MDYSVKRFEYYEKRYTNVRIIIIITYYYWLTLQYLGEHQA